MIAQSHRCTSTSRKQTPHSGRSRRQKAEFLLRFFSISTVPLTAPLPSDFPDSTAMGWRTVTGGQPHLQVESGKSRAGIFLSAALRALWLAARPDGEMFLPRVGCVLTHDYVHGHPFPALVTPAYLGTEGGCIGGLGTTVCSPSHFGCGVHQPWAPARAVNCRLVAWCLHPSWTCLAVEQQFASAAFSLMPGKQGDHRCQQEG